MQHPASASVGTGQENRKSTVDKKSPSGSADALGTHTDEGQGRHAGRHHRGVCVCVCVRHPGVEGPGNGGLFTGMANSESSCTPARSSESSAIERPGATLCSLRFHCE
ncbi:unnamed protein product [Plutella xylostella]|uniref:(diamondback moth) hypothetical protein n=1 Tax=Plutella xylostella TaxID=51655 RepID=A0A8S4G2D0_PLUXY|nr:unnamed protein product [Plutella xylostella]